uniref:NADH-ubiquinone oxidoreductase chain 2 n=1 Tax=Ptiliidae sp. BMNH 1274723 TaxID=1796536 RepID=A0A126TG98_9COLE|nr:NADH dehydrogenase subunit 2 [Ptiliidae sp. BMNH 1274723]
MNQLYKFFFYSMLMFSTLITISSYSWFGMWIGLEINLLSIIPLMNNNKNLLTNESSIKYFLVQSIASMIFLLIIIIALSNKFNSIMIMMMNFSMIMKMGAAPFHFWFPMVMEGLNWNNSLILLTWQKINPMIILMNKLNWNFLTLIIFSSLMISGLMGINQISIRKMLSYSSINHMAWMISAIFINEMSWLIYFTIYSLNNFWLILIFKKMKCLYFNQLFLLMNKSWQTKLFFLMNFFSLGGLPPFIGFFPKWLVLSNLINQNLVFLSLILIMTTILTLHFYLQITLKTMILNSEEIKFFNQNPSYSMFMNKFFILALFLCPVWLT